MSAKHQLTEYGYLSSRLLCSKLSDLCVDKVGVQTGPFGSQLHKEDYVDIGTPIITVEHLGNNRISHIDTPFVTDEDKKRLSKYQLKSGDIVFSRVGSVDRRALVRKEEDGWLFSGRCLRVRVDKTKIDPVYLSYFFGLESFKKYIRSIAVGATMPSINTKILSDIPIYYPECLEEQKRIAHIFITNDEKVNINNQTNQTLEEMAQAIFKSWFVDFDPVKAKMNGEQPEGMDAATASLFPDKLVESALGLIPEGWAVNQLSDICKNHSQSYDLKSVDEVVFVNTGDVLEGDFLHKDYSSVEGLPGQAKKAIKEDDILYSEIRPKNKRYAYVDFDVSDYVVSTKFMVIQANEKVHPRLLYMMLTRQNTIDEFNVIADSRSGTFPQITFKAISNLEFCMAPREVQDAFVAQVMPMIKLQRSLKTENKQLADLRDTLLPKLLSGEIELGQAQELAEVE
ncbi:restriction endonuclease subunit S [Vibrio parahaemolyticus]|nr:restriction endonuclease subunit S [Vibrio parahaemolyticus]EHU5130495.1 restriction endonuclease subunit S [Vibrio parahaemolyticus]